MKYRGPTEPPEVLARFHAELDLVDIIARQVHRSVSEILDLDDLLGAGREGLWEAARRYDPSTSVPFRNYANLRVRGAVLDAVRRYALPRRAYQRFAVLEAARLLSAGELGQTSTKSSDLRDGGEGLDKYLQGKILASAMALAVAEASNEDAARRSQQDPESAYASAELLELIRGKLDELTPEEAMIIRRHSYRGHEFKEIAADLGVSSSWVGRLHARAIAHLRALVRKPDE